MIPSRHPTNPRPHQPGALLTRVDSRSRADILEARVVNRLCKDGITRLVPARKANTRGRRTATARDLDLEATDIRLRVIRTSMQSNSLSPDQIVSTRNVLGHGEGALSAVCIEDLGAPRGCCTRVSVLGNLEEGSGRGGLCVGYFGHVD